MNTEFQFRAFDYRMDWPWLVVEVIVVIGIVVAVLLVIQSWKRKE